jgi:PAS domain-containing protein
VVGIAPCTNGDREITGIVLTFTEGQRTLVLDAGPLPLAGQSGRKILLTFKDITTRKAAEVANAHLPAIVESSDDAILSTDLEGIIYELEQRGGAPLRLHRQRDDRQIDHDAHSVGSSQRGS